MQPLFATHTETEKESSASTTFDHPARVILFNDDVHSFDEVISQLIKAIGCSSAYAESIAWEVHTRGKACCYEGDLSSCLRVSGILEEISLHTQIEP